MILIFPYAKRLNNSCENPKNYPYWNELVSLLKKDYDIIQVGLQNELKIQGISDFKFNLKLKEIENLIKECDFWISVDSFAQHLVNNMKEPKPGVVLWSLSNPEIFGYEYNLNILKDQKYLRPDQFGIWEQAVYNPEAYLDANIIYNLIKENKYGK
jgi:ADP-heptose:LPS heptosyltransferase